MTSKNGKTSGPAIPAGPPVHPVLRGHEHGWADPASPAYELCPACRFYDDPIYRAAELNALLEGLAELRYLETIAYAAAFLAAPGTEQAKIQAARAATVELHLHSERAAAMVAAFQLLLKQLPELVTA